MDSSIPPQSSPSRRKLRPWYLVVAMVLTWFLGVQGMTNGCNVAMVLRDGTRPDVATATQNARGVVEMMEFLNVTAALGGAVALETMQEMRRVIFPLSVAQVLLSALLVAASGLAMSGRKGARTLAIQAVVANIALGCVGYALLRGVRAASIDAMVAAAAALPETVPYREAFSSGAVWWWAHRFRFVTFELGTLALAALALTRTRTKTFFDAVARMTESTEEP